MHSLARRVTAEALGTFGLVFIGCAAVVAEGLGGYGLMGVAVAHAMVLSVLVSATMYISGGHLNPAVTIGFLVSRKIPGRDAVAYIAGQLAAAILAAVLVKTLFPSNLVNATSLGTPLLQQGIGFGQGVALEAIFTFFLMSAIFGTAVAKAAPAIGGFGIGLSLLFLILIGGGLTGAAMNPARALGPALVSQTLIGHAVYWIGPILGASAAAMLWGWMLKGE